MDDQGSQRPVRQPEYQAQFERKKEFENPCAADEIARVAEWTQVRRVPGAELRPRGASRSTRPRRASRSAPCSPSLGFARTLPFVQGSQGCTAYFRSHFARHFKEPIATVSRSMTEDAAVFGGLYNMVEGAGERHRALQARHDRGLHHCMAEVIGDDLQRLHRHAKARGAVPDDLPVPFAHTPSFAGTT